MLLTVSKRLEFSASRRLFVPSWTASENLVAFGPESEAKHGAGRNYVAYFIFSGSVNKTTGMLMNISEIKRRAGKVLAEGYDHKFLNADNPVFRELPPTAENVARQLFLDVAPAFAEVGAQLMACHLQETRERSATCYSDGAVEANYWVEFSAARRTRSPLLNDQENDELFGAATSIHGHNYRARLTFQTENYKDDKPLVRHDRISKCLHSLQAELDHRYLNEDVFGLRNRPMTTESLAEYIYERVNATLFLHRVRLHERDDFFAEYWNDEAVFVGLQKPFYSAHRLHAPGFSRHENETLYGKCNNPAGHGHAYITETTVGGKYNERSGTLVDFAKLQEAVTGALEPWQNRHLDLETKDFRDTASTGENIVRVLWQKIDTALKQRLVRLRLWETANNRFTLRRT